MKRGFSSEENGIFFQRDRRDSNSIPGPNNGAGHLEHHWNSVVDEYNLGIEMSFDGLPYCQQC